MAITTLDELRKECFDTHYANMFTDLVAEMKNDSSDLVCADFDQKYKFVVYTEEKVYIGVQNIGENIVSISWFSAQRNPCDLEV